jgi:2-methylfumaryl-CoA hydratase
VVHVRTVLETEHSVLCAFERKALVRAGRLDARPHLPHVAVASTVDGHPGHHYHSSLPAELRDPLEPGTLAGRRIRFPSFLEDFAPGQIYTHAVGKTVGESEHMQLTTLLRNSHPLHFDELYCKDNSFTKTRVVYGGLVFAWIAALQSRDLAGNALWDVHYEAGAHPAAVGAGDTLYAASKVLSVEPRGADGLVTMALVGVKNTTAESAFDRYGEALFAPELGKKGEGESQMKVPEKVFEVRRTLLVRKRSA